MFFSLLLLGCADYSVGKVPVDADNDGYDAEVDCDDGDKAVNPSAEELCDQKDNDCDDWVDEGAVGETWYLDEDGDGYGGAASDACGRPDDPSTTGGDCDDGDPAVHPDADETCDGVDQDCDGAIDDDAIDGVVSYADADGDGYGDAALAPACEPTGSLVDGDCDDTDAAVNPGAVEACTDGLDLDCDGVPGGVDADADGVYACEDCDDADAAVAGATPWYIDADGDGAGAPSAVVEACERPAGASATADDCDDADAARGPSAVEFCDGVDQDCDGAVDEDACDAVVSFEDGDGDGYGGASLGASCAPTGVTVDGDCDDADAGVHPGASETCTDGRDLDCDGAPGGVDADGDGVFACEDCDDADPTAYPGATEVCDAADVDEDCDGDADDDDAGVTGTTRWYLDRDGDGVGNSSAAIDACSSPAGAVATGGDCDDTDATAYPGAIEVCDAYDVDEDCDGLADDDDVSAAASSWGTWFADRDRDGFGDPTRPLSQCEAPSGYVEDDTDCDDADSGVNPAAEEVCDGRTDEDCDTLVDDADLSVSGQETTWEDADGDGYGDPAARRESCEALAGFVDNEDDCDDTRGDVSPGGDEACDASDVDEDCDGLADDDDPTVWGTSTTWEDADDDGYGDPAVARESCEALAGWVANDADCDDARDDVSPDGHEVCDGADADEDCDTLADDDDPTATGADTTWIDADGDGLGDPAVDRTSCEAVTGWVDNDDDCDDGDDAVGEAEVRYVDADGDGFGDATTFLTCADLGAPSGDDCDDGDGDVFPGAEDVCGDGIDADCSGADTPCPLDRWSGTYDVLAGASTVYRGDGYVGNFGYAIAGGDFDGDGLGELVASEASYGVYLLDPVLGAGNLDADAVATRGYTPTNVTEIVAAGDLDGDGIDDFAGASRAAGESFLALGGHTESEFVWTDCARDVAAGGTAVDGVPTVAFTLGGCGGTLDAVFVDADGVVVAERAALSAVDTSITTGDFDGDGWSDLASAYGTTVRVYRGPLASSVAAGDYDVSLTGAAYYTSVPTPADGDGDGYTDLVAACTVEPHGSYRGSVWLLDARDDGTSTIASATIAEFQGTDADGQNIAEEYGVAFGDADADGHPDALLAQQGQMIHLLYGPFAGTIAVSGDVDATFTMASNGGWLAKPAFLPDIDGDGGAELVLSDSFADNTLTNDGSVYLYPSEP